MTRLRDPFRFDASGRTAVADDAAWIRGLIEQILFTAPGERVRRPEFGSGLVNMVFGPASDEAAAAAQYLVQAALQQWLGGLVEVESVRVEGDDATLRVDVHYVVLRTRERHTAAFVRPGGAP